MAFWKLLSKCGWTQGPIWGWGNLKISECLQKNYGIYCATSSLPASPQMTKCFLPSILESLEATELVLVVCMWPTDCTLSLSQRILEWSLRGGKNEVISSSFRGKQVLYLFWHVKACHLPSTSFYFKCKYLKYFLWVWQPYVWKFIWRGRDCQKAKLTADSSSVYSCCFMKQA